MGINPLGDTPRVRHITCTLNLSRLALMNPYVERNRPALSFVDIGIALRDYPDAGYCAPNPGNSIRVVRRRVMR